MYINIYIYIIYGINLITVEFFFSRVNATVESTSLIQSEHSTLIGR